jgi:hypothetical protein
VKGFGLLAALIALVVGQAFVQSAMAAGPSGQATATVDAGPNSSSSSTGPSGFFVIGDGNAIVGNHVYFWGSQWAKNNIVSGGPAPSAFKGFAESVQPPPCGGIWTAQPGNSGKPPDTVPPAIIVVVTSKVTKSGSAIAVTAATWALVTVDPGYGPNPGHAGTGQVTLIC